MGVALWRQLGFLGEALHQGERSEKGSAMRRKFELFKDRKGDFHWRLVSSKKVIAVSSEGYAKKAGAKQGIRSVIKALTGEEELPIIDQTITMVSKVTSKTKTNGTNGRTKRTAKPATKVTRARRKRQTSTAAAPA